MQGRDESPYMTGLSPEQILGFDRDLRFSLKHCHCICGCKRDVASLFQSVSKSWQLATLFKTLRRHLQYYQGPESNIQITLTLKAIYNCSACQYCLTKHEYCANKCKTIFDWKRRLRSGDSLNQASKQPFIARDSAIRRLNDPQKLRNTFGLPSDFHPSVSWVICNRLYLLEGLTQCTTGPNPRGELFRYSLDRLKESLAAGDNSEVLDEHLHVILGGLLCSSCYDELGDDDRIVELWKGKLFGPSSKLTVTTSATIRCLEWQNEQHKQESALQWSPPPAYSQA